MTREEEIMDKAIELAKKAEISRNILPKSTLVATAVDMAKWVDKHPRKGLVDIEKAWKFCEDCIEDCMGKYMESWSSEMRQATHNNFIKAMEE